MRSIAELRIKLFADGADKGNMLEMYRNPHIQGFTTNPTLMRKAGVSDYQAFALDILETIKDKPISFEVFADELDEMAIQAHQIASWGPNIYVKIPVMNTKGEFTGSLIRQLSTAGISLNITAVMTLDQVAAVTQCLTPHVNHIISVFAGRIADTGVDPIPLMQQALALLSDLPNTELLWASPRELLNVMQANDIGCHIITATSDILNKLTLIGKSLHDFSLETVNMFYRDATAAGFKILSLEEAV